MAFELWPDSDSPSSRTTDLPVRLRPVVSPAGMILDHASAWFSVWKHFSKNPAAVRVAFGMSHHVVYPSRSFANLSLDLLRCLSLQGLGIV